MRPALLVLAVAMSSLLGCQEKGTCITADEGPAALCLLNYPKSACLERKNKGEFVAADATGGVETCRTRGYTKLVSPQPHELDDALKKKGPVTYGRTFIPPAKRLVRSSPWPSSSITPSCTPATRTPPRRS
jgi:hypothetical protein